MNNLEHDRLGSVRQAASWDYTNTEIDIVRVYTYEPYGDLIATEGTELTENPFMFTGQWYDAELGQYYLRARMYSPKTMRFTTRDPVFGRPQETLTLHKYLYCGNDPINRIDPWGLIPWPISDQNPKHWESIEIESLIHENVIPFLNNKGIVNGPFEAFGSRGPEGIGIFDMKIVRPYDTFEIEDGINLIASEFGNYLTGYSCTYLWGSMGEYGVRQGGHYYSYYQYNEPDDIGSRYFISAGVLMAFKDKPRKYNNFSYISARRTLLDYIYEILSTEEKYDQDQKILPNQGRIKLEEWEFIDSLKMFEYFWNTTSR